MKRTIFLYLFLFAALWIVFQYVHNSKYSANAENRIAKLEKAIVAKDSLNGTLQEKMAVVTGFSLAGNVNAQEYFEKSDKTVSEIITLVSDAVIEKNTAQGNDLISYKGDTRPFLINSVQVLNHRWLIADFTDGNTWGEVIVRYFINEDGSVDLEVVEELLH